MKARLFVMFALCVSLVLVPTWTVSAQGPKPTPTPVRGKVLPPSPEPTSQPKGYNPQVELSPASDWDAAKPFARAAMSFAGTSAAPRSPRALGQPGFSLRYVQTLGFVGEAYTSDTTHINYPYGIGSDGTNVWIAESLGDRALKFASDGTFLMQIGQAGYRDGVSTSISMDWLSDVAVDGSGNIWVVEQGADQVYKFNSSGVYQRALGQMWTSGIGPNQFNNPCGVAFDGSGNVYVSDGDNHRVQIFTNTGTSAFATIGTGVAGSANNQFRNPRQIAIDSGNRLYVADSGNNRVQIWDVSNPASASYIATIGTGVAGSGNDQLRSPAGVAVDASKIYVADSSNHRVQIFDRTTRAYQGTIGTGVVGSGNDQFNFPTDVAVVGNLVYVADNGNSRVQQIVTSGPPSVRTFGTTGVPYVTDGSHYNQPSGIAIAGDGSMYVTEARGQRLLKLNSAGTMQWTIGEAGVGSGVDNNHLNYPNGVALDSSGRAYVADSSNQRVQIFDSTGAYVATMGVTGSTGTGNDRFNDPQGVATDTANNIYVADRGNHRVQIFDSSRAYVATLGVAGVWGTDNAHLNSPVDVFVDSAGNIYVADRDNHRVQIFNSSRAYVRTIGITGSSGSDFEHLSSPVAVAVDTAGRTYVADQWGGRVQVFDSTGAYLATVGNSGGKQTGQMRSTGGLAFDNAGNLWIAEVLNHRLQKYAIGVPGWLQTNINGFGVLQNQLIMGLAPFGGQLYAGTYNFSGSGAQLWRTGSAWTSVMTNGFGDVINLGIDYLIEFNGQLYASTYNWNNATNTTNGGQIWRSSNGTTWDQVVTSGFGDSTNGEIPRMAVFNSQIYASTWSFTNTHGAEIWRSNSGDAGSWSRVVSNGFGDPTNTGIAGLGSFNGYLYAGVSNWNSTTSTSTGGTVWRSASGDLGTWNQVSTAGFGSANNDRVMSFAGFNGALYAGTRNWTTGIEIWRCTTCDNGGSWTQVVGPAGSIGSGFGKITNGRLETLLVFNNMLYATTYNNNTGGVIGTGAEVWRTANGTNWEQVGFAGFGDSRNMSIYSVAAFNNSLYFPTYNPSQGTEVWQMLNQLYLPLILR